MVVTAAVVMEIFLTQVLIRQCLLAAATVNLSSSFYGADNNRQTSLSRWENGGIEK